MGAVVGDCLGAPFEGAPGPLPAEAFAALARDRAPLAWTDDSVMTVALAESLVRCGDLDEHDLAAGFAARWAEAPQAGYSTRTGELLARIHAGTPWREAHRGAGRPSNGAAMRVAPVALVAAGDLGRVLTLAERSAAVTHPHPGAVAGARTQAVAIATAVRYLGPARAAAGAVVEAARRAAGDPVLEQRMAAAVELVAADQTGPQEVADRLGAGLAVQESVPAAICAFARQPDSFASVVTFAVRLGSDTDTVASMAGAIAGALLGEGAIPRAWLERVPDLERVRALADELHALAVR